MALAKTTRPRLTGVLGRHRLFRVLDRHADRPLTWVTGPPGSGKTTLVGSYLQRGRRRTLWYQMDEGDRDVATFFYYLGQAVPGPRPLPPLTPEYQADLRTFARRFFRDLFGRLGPRFALVLDNHQDVDSDARLNETLVTAVDEVPPGGRIFVLSRARPPSVLSRFHATREVGVVDWPELRLTPAEARALARRLGPRSFRRETLRALVAAAEGWAAGLVLLLRAPDPAARGPTGPPASAGEALFDYFADEVFRASDRTSQSILLEVAFLPMLSAPMAAVLTGRADAGRTLDALARRHYFVQRLEADMPLYRLHPLFQAFLRTRARATLRPRRLRTVQVSAARLLVEAGRADDAAELLVEAQDWDGLGELIRAHAASHVTQGRTQTLERWLAQLPPERVDRDAWLLYWQGMCRQAFDPGEGRRLFERALTLFRKEQNASGTFLAWAAAVDTFLHEQRDFAPLDRWIATFDEIAREAPRYPSPAIEARVVISMTGALVWRQPGHPEIAAWLNRLQALAAANADPDLHILAKHAWWIHIGTHGDWARAAPVAEELGVLAEREGASPMMRLMALFSVARSQNMTAAFDRCRQTVTRALQLARTTGLRLWTSQFLADRVAADLAEGKLESAGRTLEIMAREVTGARPLNQNLHQYLAAWHALETGDVTRAQAHIERTSGIGAPLIEGTVRVLAAHVAHASGQDTVARAQLARALELVRHDGFVFSAFGAGVASAQIELDHGDEEAGLQALREALPVGRAERQLNHWPWRPRVMARLCVKALEAGIEVDYVRELIRVRRLVPEIPPVHLEAWPWPIRLFTLGRFQIVRDDVPVTFPGKVPRKPLAVLQMLVARDHGGLAEAQLLDALWPDADGDAALQALAMALHRLRTILGVEGALTRHAGRVALDPRVCWVDVHAFDHALATAEQALASAGPDASSWLETRRWTRKGAELYRGPFLGEDGAQPWAAPIADRLRARWVRHLCALADHWTRTGHWEDAIETCLTAIEADACAEPAYIRLMTAYARAGRRAEASRAYERCRAALATGLGLTPSRDLEALHQALLAPSAPHPLTT